MYGPLTLPVLVRRDHISYRNAVLILLVLLSSFLSLSLPQSYAPYFAGDNRTQPAFAGGPRASKCLSFVTDLAPVTRQSFDSSSSLSFLSFLSLFLVAYLVVLTNFTESVSESVYYGKYIRFDFFPISKALTRLPEGP